MIRGQLIHVQEMKVDPLKLSRNQATNNRHKLDFVDGPHCIICKSNQAYYRKTKNNASHAYLEDIRGGGLSLFENPLSDSSDEESSESSDEES